MTAQQNGAGDAAEPRMRARAEVSDADWAVLEPLLLFPQRADFMLRASSA